MSILDYFCKKKKNTAGMAKDRLQIIVAHQRSGNNLLEIDYLPQLKEDILKVISKYIEIDPTQMNVQLDTSDNNCPILELNVALPEDKRLAK